MAETGKATGLTPTQTWRLLVDTLDEVEARSQRKVRVGRPKKRLIDLELGGIKLAEQLKRRLDKVLRAQGPSWIPEKEFLEAFNSFVSALDRLGRNVRLARKAEKEAMAGLTQEQLREVHIAELKRSAQELTDEDVRVIVGTWHSEDLAEAVVAVAAKERADREAVMVAKLGSYAEKGAGNGHTKAKAGEGP